MALPVQMTRAWTAKARGREPGFEGAAIARTGAERTRATWAVAQGPFCARSPKKCRYQAAISAWPTDAP